MEGAGSRKAVGVEERERLGLGLLGIENTEGHFRISALARLGSWSRASFSVDLRSKDLLRIVSRSVIFLANSTLAPPSATF